MTRALALVTLAGATAACGPRDAPAPPQPPATLAELAWLDGVWQSDTYALYQIWVPQPGVIWGIELHATGYDLYAIDAGAGGAAQLRPGAEGGTRRVYTHRSHGDGWVTFASSAQLDISAYTIERERDDSGERLGFARHNPTGPNRDRLRPASPCPSSALVENALEQLHRTPVVICSPFDDGRYIASVATDGTTTYASVWMVVAGGLTQLHEERRP